MILLILNYALNSDVYTTAQADEKFVDEDEMAYELDKYVSKDNLNTQLDEYRKKDD